MFTPLTQDAIEYQNKVREFRKKYEPIVTPLCKDLDIDVHYGVGQRQSNILFEGSQHYFAAKKVLELLPNFKLSYTKFYTVLISR